MIPPEYIRERCGDAEIILFKVRWLFKDVPEKISEVLYWQHYGTVMPDTVTTNGSVSLLSECLAGWSNRFEVIPAAMNPTNISFAIKTQKEIIDFLVNEGYIKIDQYNKHYYDKLQEKINHEAIQI